MRKSLKVLLDKSEYVIGAWEEADVPLRGAPHGDQYHQTVAGAVKELKDAVAKVKGES